MPTQKYKDWLKKREGSEPILQPDGVGGAPTHGHGYAYGRMTNGKFVPEKSAATINEDLNYAKGTVGKIYVTQDALDSMKGKTKSELQVMLSNPPAGLSTRLEKHEMDRLQNVSISVAEKEAKLIAGDSWENLSVAKKETLIDARFRGGNLLYGKNTNLAKHVKTGNEAGMAYELLYNSNGGPNPAPGNDIRQMELVEAWLSEKSPEEQERFKRELDAYINKDPTRQDQREKVHQRLQEQKEKGRIPETLEEIFAPKIDSTTPTPPTFAPEQSQSKSGFEPVSFEEIDGLSTDDMTHQLNKAMATGGSTGQQLLGRLSRAVTGQMLARMDGLVKREIERHTSGQSGFGGGISGTMAPIPEPDEKARLGIEKVLNHPSNAGTFERISVKIQRILEHFNDADPNAVLVSKALEAFKNGDLKVPTQTIFMPDLLPQKDGAPHQPRGDERVVDISGINVPIKLPQVEMTTVETPENEGWAGQLEAGRSKAVRGEDGVIRVQRYVRKDGTIVAAHSRTAPDGDVRNNLTKREG